MNDVIRHNPNIGLTFIEFRQSKAELVIGDSRVAIHDLRFLIHLLNDSTCVNNRRVVIVIGVCLKLMVFMIIFENFVARIHSLCTDFVKVHPDKASY